jgi:hypothetical protein
MSFFVKAAVAALKKYPVMNASVDGTDIVYHGYFDIGIAVGSPRGLVVPTLQGEADRLHDGRIHRGGRPEGLGLLNVSDSRGAAVERSRRDLPTGRRRPVPPPPMYTLPSRMRPIISMFIMATALSSGRPGWFT